MPCPSFIRLSALSAILALSSDPLNAATIEVPGDYPTIQEAVNASSNGDVILVGPGTYTGEGQRVIEVLGKSLTIRATDGHTKTFIDGEGVRGCVRINNSATLNLDGFTIRNGFADYPSTYPYGGALWLASGEAAIKNCAMIDNSSGSAGMGGGAIAGFSCIADFENCLLADNSTMGPFGGAAAFGFAVPVFQNCIIRDNVSSGNYGAVFVDLNAGGIDSSVVCNNSGSQQTYGPSFSDDSILSGDCEASACGDLDGNYFADVNDVLILISAWGTGGPGLTSADFNFDGVVAVEDLLYLISVFGNDCTPLGACCLQPGWCEENVSEAYCDANNGTWFGPGSDCGQCF